MGKVEPTSRELGTLAKMLREGELGMPEIQRDFVWNRPQICRFLESLYRDFPFGTMLFWKTGDAVPTKPAAETSAEGPVEFVLDGQQRITAIKQVLFDSDVDIMFNIDEERFDVRKRAMDADSSWIAVRELWNTDPLAFAIEHGFLDRSDAAVISPRLSKAHGIQKRLVPIQIVKEFDYDEVTEIFIRVNSEGTRLAGVDLAMALIALRLPDTFNGELNDFAESLEDEGWKIGKGTIVRCLMAVALGESKFARLRARLTAHTSIDALHGAWMETQSAIHTFLTSLKSELGVESWAWVASNNALVVPIAYIAKTPPSERYLRANLRWFLLSLAWQRYGGGAEDRMNDDLGDLKHPNPFVALERRLRRQVGRDLEITPADLEGGGTTGRRRFLLHSYVAARRNEAYDWFEDVRLSSSNLGKNRSLEQHHIFPRAILRNAYESENIDELANIAFLSKDANLKVSDDNPMEYLTKIPADCLEQQFVPMNPNLWAVDAFPQFLEERRQLVADGINQVIEELR